MATLLFACILLPQTHAQAAELLVKKVERLEAKATKGRGVIELDADAFEEVMAKPRNYTMVVLFTAISPEFQCVPCKNFDPEYRLVAAGWNSLEDKSRLFFGVLDFKLGQPVFQKFGMNSAPSVLFFPLGDKYDRYDFGKSGFQAEPFAQWLSALSGVPLKVKRPFDFMAASINVLVVLGVLFAGFYIYNRAGKVVRSKYLWSSISMFTIFVMISGHMWNQIRHPPYTMPSRDGRPSFIAAGFQTQFGLETQIVAIIYAVLCGSVVSLFSSIPRIENPAKQRFAVWVWMAIMGIMFSILLQLFRLKNPAYPYRLLF
ncbi:oligosaccharyl transferase subunit ost3/OST6 [Podila humilis]|nr:oligosaccharyl transferase subunit ost3/OST6 [Podila humilis]